MGFQASVNAQPSPAVEGDFASDNPRFSMDAGPGGLITDPTVGTIIGRFAWADGNQVVTNAKPGGAVARLGFAAREGNEIALITAWLGESSMTIPPAMPITLHTDVDVWARATVANGTYGQKAFAKNTDGTIQPAAAGATVAGYTETPWYLVTAGNIGELVKLSLRP
jgi:hypothetical protein